MNTQNALYQEAIGDIAAKLPIKTGRFLITGASGLIGSCIVDTLLNANRQGASFEIFVLGRDASKLEKRFPKEKVRIIAQDIANPIEIEDLDYIIHAASNADPRSYALYPAETVLTNVLGAHSVLNYCKNKKTRALLTSTFEVYGKLNQDVYSEEDYGLIDYNQLRAGYPESKRVSELLFKSYHDEYGVDCVIARLSSIYGPTMSPTDNKAHAQFIHKALAGENIVLKSEGLQKRTYCYVIDAVSAIFAILFKGTSGEAYNVANKNSIATIKQVAKTVADLKHLEVVFDLPSELERKGFSKPQNCILATDKLEALDWEGKYTLEAGLTQTLSILEDNQ